MFRILVIHHLLPRNQVWLSIRHHLLNHNILSLVFKLPLKHKRSLTLRQHNNPVPVPLLNNETIRMHKGLLDFCDDFLETLSGELPEDWEEFEDGEVDLVHVRLLEALREDRDDAFLVLEVELLFGLVMTLNELVDFVSDVGGLFLTTGGFLVVHAVEQSDIVILFLIILP